MEPKSHMDAFGAVSLVLFALLLAANQVVIKVGAGGFQPVLMAGLRSLGVAVVLFLWLKFRALDATVPKASWPAMALFGAVFGAEFIFLFTALDLTTVVRASVIFYAMPFWAALGAWLFLKEPLTPMKSLGLLAAFLGMAWAIAARPGDGQASLAGDLCAMVASIGWAAILVLAKSPRIKILAPEVQLFWQTCISIPILLGAALLFGPLVRDLSWIHWSALAFQIFVVASFGFLFWLWLLKIYPATSVASFSFLSPIFSVALGAWLLDEPVGLSLLGALGLVVLGLILVNRTPRRS